MSEYNIKVNDPLVLTVGEKTIVCHVQSIDGSNAVLKMPQRAYDGEGLDIELSSCVISGDKGKTECVVNSYSIVESEEGNMFNATIELRGDTQYPNEAVANESYMIYNCPTQDDINNFLDESGSNLTHVPEGDSIYGLFFALFKEQDRRIQELERALSIQSDTKVSH